MKIFKYATIKANINEGRSLIPKSVDTIRVEAVIIPMPPARGTQTV